MLVARMTRLDYICALFFALAVKMSSASNRNTKKSTTKLGMIGQETLTYMENCVAELNDIGHKLIAAREATEHFKEEDNVSLEPCSKENKTVIEVTREKTYDAAQRLVKEGYDNTCVLNFASAKHPGGGFLGGATAQEENLSRVSGLFWCIEERPMYQRNISARGNKGLYLHDLLYSPGVPVFRDSTSYEFLGEEDLFDVAVITCPSPNLRAIHPGTVSQEEIAETMKERIRRILVVAANKQHDALVLGAFGCGAFRNDPTMVASIFNAFFADEFQGIFKKIIYGVYEKENGPNITVFKNVIQT